MQLHGLSTQTQRMFPLYRDDAGRTRADEGSRFARPNPRELPQTSRPLAPVRLFFEPLSLLLVAS